MMRFLNVDRGHFLVERNSFRFLRSVDSFERANRSAGNKRNEFRSTTSRRRIARGEMSRRRAIPAGGIHRRAAWNFMNPSKELYLRLAYAMFGRIVPRMKSCGFLPGGDMVPPARSVGQN